MNNFNRKDVLVYSDTVRTLMSRVYGIMTLALVISGAVAYYTSTSPAIQSLIRGSQINFIISIVCLFGLVYFISSRVETASVGSLLVSFIIYSVLNGAFLSAIFLEFTKESIYTAFYTTAAMFAAMSVVGFVTKRDLSSFGSFLTMGLLGIIIASFINIFMQSPGIYWAVSYLGVLIFLGLTVYNTNKLKNIAYQIDDNNDELILRYSIVGALTLYLSFINLFVFILRVMDSRK